MSLGAGRIVYQSITRIDQAIASGDFATNTAYLTAIDAAIDAGKAIHVMGLLSSGCTVTKHISMPHFNWPQNGAPKDCTCMLFSMVATRLRAECEPSLARAEATLRALGVGRIASVHGRYWAMDRDNRWDRIEKSHTLLTQGTAEQHADSAAEALSAAYARGEDDEFVAPTGTGILPSSETAMLCCS